MSNKMSVMDSEKATYSEEPRTFRYLRPFWVSIWLFVMLSLGIFFAIIEMRAGEYGGSLFFSFGVLTFMFLGIYGTAGGSDIYIAKDGISRKIFGKSWQTILWDNVKLISIREWTNTNTRKTNKHMAILPVVKQGFRLFPSGKMAFSDQMGNSQEFMKLLNKYVSLYHIKIESSVGGIKTFPAKLE